MTKELSKSDSDCNCAECLATIQRLEEEVESLWFMLDEIKESQKFTKEHSEEMSKQINKQIAMLKLMQSRKAEA
tara:strand:+ start:143 stop:364 length:222 start_codon:yes stop_codon:yes gene_type:complete